MLFSSVLISQVASWDRLGGFFRTGGTDIPLSFAEATISALVWIHNWWLGHPLEIAFNISFGPGRRASPAPW